ncbi:MAG: FAD-dependent oxidoreductase [Ectothiorhodospiraceae bacterium]|nr:FAD-dependent oxidoreductase [Ectothiorhodospiraceae bacterium]
MTFFSKPSTNKPAVSSTEVQASFIDILYDHEHYLKENGGKIGQPMPGLQQKKVAIVGAGPAGLLAAYQLMQTGVEVDVFESEDQYGGRVYSYQPIESEAALFEMGAMRVPPSEKIFNFYADVFDMHPSEFPDPGKVMTDIIFDGEKYPWEANQPPPSIFTAISESWDSFVTTLDPLINLLKEGTKPSFETALKQWQLLIKSGNSENTVSYSNISFYEGLVHLFVDNYKKYGLENPWGEKEFSLFGALGLGSGGFGPLYQVNFAEIVRLIVNGLETDQRFYACGLDRLVDGFATTETGFGLVKDRIKYDCKITKIETEIRDSRREVKVEVNYRDTLAYDAVIVATTTRSMQVDMGITLPPTEDYHEPILDTDCNTGVRQLHLMNSSKLFVLTRTKFWKDKKHQNIPENIQTDGLVKGLYCLDYPDTDHGVILMSYTWGDDSTKYIAIKDPNERLNLLIDSLKPFVSDFTDILNDEVIREHTKLIDWQDQANFYGAFKLNYPGQDFYNQSLYYQFTQSRNGVYLAGDSISWSGGWIEGALQTGMNAAAAVLNQFCPESLFNDNPMTQATQADQYDYR